MAKDVAHHLLPSSFMFCFHLVATKESLLLPLMVLVGWFPLITAKLRYYETQYELSANYRRTRRRQWSKIGQDMVVVVVHPSKLGGLMLVLWPWQCLVSTEDQGGVCLLWSYSHGGCSSDRDQLSYKKILVPTLKLRSEVLTGWRTKLKNRIKIRAFHKMKKIYHPFHLIKFFIRPWAPISKSDHPPKGRKAAFYTGSLSDSVIV